MKAIHTPCLRKCALDATKTFCISCKRTKDELFYWSQYTEEEQLRIIEELKSRTFGAPS